MMILRNSFAKQTTISIQLRFTECIHITAASCDSLTMSFLAVRAVIMVVIVVVGIDTIVIVGNVIVVVIYVQRIVWRILK